MSAMYNPPHPGEILADTVLRADGGISVTAFAEKLKMTRAAISRVVNGKAGISPELSLRLEESLGTSRASHAQGRAVNITSAISRGDAHATAVAAMLLRDINRTSSTLSPCGDAGHGITAGA
jgi:antitoxin HigA-1